MLMFPAGSLSRNRGGTLDCTLALINLHNCNQRPSHFLFGHGKPCLFTLLLNPIGSFLFVIVFCQSQSVLSCSRLALPSAHTHTGVWMIYSLELDVFGNERGGDMDGRKHTWTFQEQGQVSTAVPPPGAEKKNIAEKKKIHTFHSLTRLFLKSVKS